MEPPIPPVTVAIVAYRHEDFVQEALDSTLDEPDCDVVVVDDASPDGTAAVIRRWVSGLDPRSRSRVRVLLNTRNIGLNASLNAALGMTRTRYFAYLAGDDWHLPGRLARQTADLDSSGAVLSYGDCLRADRHGRLEADTFYGTHPYWREHIGAADPVRTLLRHGNWIPAPTVMLRTASLRALGGYDERLPYEDQDTYARLLHGGSASFLDGAPLAVHRELEDSWGARLFRSESLPWIQAVATTEMGFLDRRPDLAPELAAKIYVRALRAGRLGADPSWVRKALDRVRPHLRGRDRRSWWWHRSRAALPRPRRREP